MESRLLRGALRGAALAVLSSAALGAFGAVEAAEPGRSFGAPLTLTEATPLAEVLRDPEAHADEPILLEGRIADVCQKKGCWTLLQDGAAVVRVRFADYAFFVPTESRGQRASVQGRVVVRTLSEREARHYAAESAGQDPAVIEGPQREVGFVATGVRFDPPL